ncbi:MAG: flagellar protein FlgN [Methylotenera sp.]
MKAPASIKAISFEQDAQLAKDLLATIRSEQTALVKADIDAIEALLDEKSEMLQRMNVVVLNRYEALAANGFEPNEAGMGEWLKQQAKPALNEAWAVFKKTLIQAKELNRLNGMLINKHFNLNQQLLNHLQGNSNTGDVYGRNGQAKTQSTMRAALMA